MPDPSPPGDASDAAGRRTPSAFEWREDAQRVAHAYSSWCAADGRDRDRLYLAFVDALTREERAAHQLERRMSALGTADPAS